MCSVRARSIPPDDVPHSAAQRSSIERFFLREMSQNVQNGSFAMRCCGKQRNGVQPHRHRVALRRSRTGQENKTQGDVVPTPNQMGFEETYIGIYHAPLGNKFVCINIYAEI